MQVDLTGSRDLQNAGHKCKDPSKRPLCKARRRLEFPEEKIFSNAGKPVDRYGISPLCFIIIINSQREKAMVSETMNTQNIETDIFYPSDELPALMPVTGMPDTGDSGAFPRPFFVFGDEDEDMDEEDNFDDMEDDFDDDFEDEDDFDDDDDEDDDDDFEDEEDEEYDEDDPEYDGYEDE
jgi:hypothetical protein